MTLTKPALPGLAIMVVLLAAPVGGEATPGPQPGDVVATGYIESGVYMMGWTDEWFMGGQGALQGEADVFSFRFPADGLHGLWLTPFVIDDGAGLGSILYLNFWDATRDTFRGTCQVDANSPDTANGWAGAVRSNEKCLVHENATQIEVIAEHGADLTVGVQVATLPSPDDDGVLKSGHVLAGDWLMAAPLNIFWGVDARWGYDGVESLMLATDDLAGQTVYVTASGAAPLGTMADVFFHVPGEGYLGDDCTVLHHGLLITPGEAPQPHAMACMVPDGATIMEVAPIAGVESTVTFGLTNPLEA